MQLIFKSPVSKNFSQFANDLIQGCLPPVAKAILLYLLSKPSSWKLRKKDLQKTLGLSAYAVKKGIGILRNLGYLVCTRLKTGHCHWFVYDQPQPQNDPPIVTPTPPPDTHQTRMVEPSVEFPPVAFEPVIQISDKNKYPKNNYQTAEQTITPEVKTVVVSFDEELELPPAIPTEQQPAIKAIVTKVGDKLTRQQIIFALSYAITAGKVKSIPAYAQGLVKAALNGTFTPVQPAKPVVKPWDKKPPKAPPIDNLTYFKNLFKQYGERCLDAIPAEFRDRVLAG